MDLQAILSLLQNPDEFTAWFMQNWAMIVFITLFVVSFGLALFMAIWERVKTGSNKSLYFVILAPILLFASIYVLGYIAYLLQSGNPYARAVRIGFAVILPGLFFGYAFASASCMLMSTAYADNRWKYLNFAGNTIIRLLTLGWVYGLFVLPVIDGLSPLFLWLGIFTGWMMAPVFISRGYVKCFDDQEEEQVQE